MTTLPPTFNFATFCQEFQSHPSFKGILLCIPNSNKIMWNYILYIDQQWSSIHNLCCNFSIKTQIRLHALIILYFTTYLQCIIALIILLVIQLTNFVEVLPFIMSACPWHQNHSAVCTCMNVLFLFRLPYTYCLCIVLWLQHRERNHL